MKMSYLLGLLLGEMVTNLLIIPGDCCMGGVRHILSSFSELGVISSPTSILSKLPSSTPFPNHRPHGNLTPRTRSWSLQETTFSGFFFQDFSCEGDLLISVPRDLVADHHILHEPLSIETWVVVAHLHRGKLAQVLALQQREPCSSQTPQNKTCAQNKR